MLQHVTLEMRREDEARAEGFWRLLGFHPVEPPGTLPGRVVWLERHGTQVHLLWRDDPVAAPSGHAAVVVDDHDALVAELAERGYRIEPGTPQWGAARSFVRAPGGHRVELMSAPPPMER